MKRLLPTQKKSRTTPCKNVLIKQWEENPNCPCEIELYYDSAPHSFGFRQVYPDGRTGIVGGLLYHGQPDQSFAVLMNPIHGWTIHT